MATTFCPLCKSIMKDGICTNRNCGNSTFEIDFNNRINSLKKYFHKKYYKSINKSFDISISCDNSLNYDIQSTRLCINNIKSAENLIDMNIKIFKIISHTTGIERKPLVEITKYIDIKEAIGKVKKFKKHMFSFQIVSPFGDSLRTPAIWGTNDFDKWEDIGTFKSESAISEITKCVSLTHYKLHHWTLGIVDKETGIELINFFTKEQAYALFKDREIKQGNKKRSPLKHIVGEYEKHKPNEVLVDEHFRGNMEFEWRGITFKLYPPIVAEIRISKEEM